LKSIDDFAELIVDSQNEDGPWGKNRDHLPVRTPVPEARKLTFDERFKADPVSLLGARWVYAFAVREFWETLKSAWPRKEK